MRFNRLTKRASFHRDIKPSNLLLDRDGTLLVTDFGLARIQQDQSITMTGDLVGTLRYMSPEQLGEVSTVDFRSDVYSLGATLFELVSGKPAYSASSTVALIAGHSAGKGEPSAQHRAAHSPRFGNRDTQSDGPQC